MAELTYCDAAPGHEWHGPYHDREYGFPLEDDADLFERLMLEINQAGLSWLTILKKREAFRPAYGGFQPELVARYRAADRRRLLQDPGIIRNRFEGGCRHCQRPEDPRAPRHAWFLRRVAGGPPPEEQGGMGQAVQGHVQIHRRGDRERIPDEHRLFTWRSRAELSGVSAHSRAASSLVARQ
jgi:methyladenine glycosylase